MPADAPPGHAAEAEGTALAQALSAAVDALAALRQARAIAPDVHALRIDEGRALLARLAAPG